MRAVFIARLLPLARTFVSLPAGARRLPLGRFILLTTLGCGIWALVFVLIGLVSGAAWGAVSSVPRQLPLRGLLVSSPLPPPPAGAPPPPPPPPPLLITCSTALISARCVNACGKLPRWRPVTGSNSSAYSPSGEATLSSRSIRSRALLLADDRQRRDEPERADQERALLARQAVVGLLGAVAQHEAVLGQLVGDRQHGRAQALVVGPAGSRRSRPAASRRRARRSRSAGAARRRSLTPVLEDVRLDLLGGRAPLPRRARLARSSRQLVPRGRAPPSTSASRRRSAGARPRASQIPWSGSRQTAVAHSACACTIGHSRRGSRSLRWCAAGSSPAPRRTRRSGAGRRRRCRSAPGARRRSPERSSRVDSVRSRRPSIPYMICSAPSSFALEVGDELHELVGLPVEVEVVQRLQRERRVAHPRVAVVPVALAPGRLRQRRRRAPRRSRPVGHVGEALDRQRRALDGVAPAVVGACAPAASQLRQKWAVVGEALVGLVDVLGPPSPRPAHGARAEKPARPV